MRKRRGTRVICGLIALLIAGLAAGPAFSEVNVNINVGPPTVVVAEPPEMIVMEHSMVYFAPDVSVSLFFHAGYWWTPKEGRWFRSREYRGPWVLIAPRAVPVAISRMPGDFRKHHAHGHRIPYGQLKKHYDLRERDRRERRGEWKERKEDRKEHRKGKGR